MVENDVIIREGTAADMPGIFRVRTSVVENLMTSEELEERGITHASIAASFLKDSKGWVAVQSGQIIAFSIADREQRTIFALFVLPAFEGRGIGGRLLDLALQWLWDSGSERVGLATGPLTRAARFYERRGWVSTGRPDGRGDMRYECIRPVDRRSSTC